MKTLIGLVGGKQMGKNTVANIICYLTGLNPQLPFANTDVWETASIWKQVSFASPLKQVASILTGIPVKDFENEKVKRQYLPDQYINKKEDGTEELLTVRGFLQRLGTEVGRSLHPRIWEYALFNKYQIQREKVVDEEGSEEYVDKYPNWIVTDVRFPNEVEAIKSRGGLIFKVFRPGILRVYFNDSDTEDSFDHSGYYYVKDIDYDIWHLSEFSDGTGAVVTARLDELEFEGPDNHPSERSLDLLDEELDGIFINDGDFEKLVQQVRKALIEHKIIT
jgi:hypothetical protein